MQKKILIVGGTGFFGYHLCKIFLKLKYGVSSLSKSKPKKIRKLSNVKYFYGDISKEKNGKTLTLFRALEDRKEFDDIGNFSNSWNVFNSFL